MFDVADAEHMVEREWGEDMGSKICHIGFLYIVENNCGEKKQTFTSTSTNMFISSIVVG